MPLVFRITTTAEVNQESRTCPEPHQKIRNLKWIALCAMFIALNVSVGAAQAGKVYRIGILTGGTATSSKGNIDPFKDGLRELGYVEGKNIAFEYRHANGKRNRLPGLAAELVNANVDIILGTGTRPIFALKEATSTVPIIAGAAGDLVKSGVVKSLSRPGGNVTGSTRLSTELGGKRIELFKEVMSRVSRVAAIWSTRQDRAEIREIERLAHPLGVTVQPLKVRDLEGVQKAFEATSNERSEAIMILHSGFTLNNRKLLLDLTVKHRLPSMCETARWAKSGCLITYGPDLSHLYRRAAIYADKIIKGAKPADLPIEQPTKFTLVINLRTANKINLTIPPSILYRADQVIR